MATSSFHKNLHKFGQVFGKIKSYNCKYFNGFQVLGNQAPKISCALNVLHNHTVSADQKFSVAANPRKKHLSNFFGCLSTVSNTTWLENDVVFMFLKSLSLILQLLIPLFKSLITVIIRISSNLNSECNHYLQIRIC